MQAEELKEKWQESRVEVVMGRAEWRVQHARATMREIGGALDARLARLRGRMLEDTALASQAREWEASADGPRCADCHEVLKPRGKGERRYGVCPVCGTGFFPLDKELALAPGHLTPIPTTAVASICRAVAQAICGTAQDLKKE